MCCGIVAALWRKRESVRGVIAEGDLNGPIWSISSATTSLSIQSVLSRRLHIT